MTIQVTKDHYDFDRYEYKERWISYYNQAKLIHSVGPSSLLEIGVGSGFLRDYLRSRGVAVTTMDIDPLLGPDIVAHVEQFSSQTSYDVVTCFEVLEHLPFEMFRPTLTKMLHYTDRYVLLSLPHWGYTFRFTFKTPLIKFDRSIRISGIKKHSYNGQHFWEIGKRGFGIGRVIIEIRNAGWRVENTYTDIDSPYHRFFILSKP